MSQPEQVRLTYPQSPVHDWRSCKHCFPHYQHIHAFIDLMITLQVWGEEVGLVYIYVDKPTRPSSFRLSDTKHLLFYLVERNLKQNIAPYSINRSSIPSSRCASESLKNSVVAVALIRFSRFKSASSTVRRITNPLRSPKTLHAPTMAKYVHPMLYSEEIP